MSQSFNDVLNEYYKLKSQYESSLHKKKYGIIRNTNLTAKEKKQMFARLKPKCINCKKDGGTIFSNKDNVLKAVCGNTSTPCNLNIEIRKGDYIQIEDIMNIFNADIKQYKADIIKTKLHFLFGYEDETNASEQFDQLKEEFTNDSQILGGLKNNYNNIINKNKEALLLEESKLEKLIHQVKEYNILSKDNPEVLNDIVDLYISNIQPVEQQIRELKYKNMDVQYFEDTDEYKLIQQQHTLDDLEITLGDSENTMKVISNVK